MYTSGVGRRSEQTVQRIVRSTVVSRWVKDLHADTCQACDACLYIPGGSYSEGAHIVLLGRPHNGPDSVENVLCLCPACHVLFDKGGFLIQDDGYIINISGNEGIRTKLQCHSAHEIDSAMFAYHRGIHSIYPLADDSSSSCATTRSNSKREPGSISVSTQ
jgi:putative restriction endonuclease